ncbi:hypothetical protein F4779DRAFT_285264 [Xylariaceae sp. FL0662B]|nr:hypothetical protein F4779DRAFT_285264 [Xylariaceae sp. FL0662B]
MTTASETQIKGDGSPNPPPTYNEVVDDTTSQSTAATQIQPIPGPAGEGKFYYDEPGTPSIVFFLFPEPDKNEEHQPWFGQILVKCRDVPLLMREGFHWTTANVIREEGFIEKPRPEVVGLGKPNHECTITRNWFMRDLQQPSRWTACLQAHCPNRAVASKIRLDSWTPDMVKVCWSWGLSGKGIYQFDTRAPQDAYNTIYDDMPLKGWWPWPKTTSELPKESTRPGKLLVPFDLEYSFSKRR